MNTEKRMAALQKRFMALREWIRFGVYWEDPLDYYWPQIYPGVNLDYGKRFTEPVAEFRWEVKNG